MTSTGGTTWTAVPPGGLKGPVYARYVRVTLTRDPDAGRTGIRELVVTRK